MQIKFPTVMRRTWPLAMTGFFNSFTDSGFKVWAALLVWRSYPELFQNHIFLLGAAAICLLPSLLLPMITGFTADRLPGRITIVIISILKVPLLCCTELAIGTLGQGCSPVFWITVSLYSIFNAFYPPAFDGLLPAAFSERDSETAHRS